MDVRIGFGKALYFFRHYIKFGAGSPVRVCPFKIASESLTMVVYDIDQVITVCDCGSLKFIQLIFNVLLSNGAARVTFVD